MWKNKKTGRVRERESERERGGGRKGGGGGGGDTYECGLAKEICYVLSINICLFSRA